MIRFLANSLFFNMLTAILYLGLLVSGNVYCTVSEGEMVHLVLELELEQFEFEERIDGREKMVALRPDGMGRRTGQPGVGFDGFMEDLDVPPFLVDGRDAVVVEQEVA